jgi:hypothetical protein
MNITCTLCGKQLDTVKDDVNVTTEYMMELFLPRYPSPLTLRSTGATR